MSHFNVIASDATPMQVNESSPQPFQSQPINHIRELTADIEDETESFVKFVENPQQIQDEFEYERSGTDPGLIVIFNQKTFEDKDYKNRTGTNRDVNELILTFGRLGYNVDKEFIYDDLTRKEIVDILANLSKLDYSQKNSLIIIVLTHGDSGDLLRARDAPLWTNEIWEPFSSRSCPTLKNKPKFFIFQACKGEGFSQLKSTPEEIIPDTIYSAPMDSDMLVAFATVEGSQSYRHVFNGTWFIQEMCRNFSAFGRRDDVVSLLVRTTKCVATNYYYISNSLETDSQAQIRKQMPIFVSTLRKKFYLTRSKDRGLMLNLLQQQQDVVKSLQDITEKINNLMFSREI